MKKTFLIFVLTLLTASLFSQSKLDSLDWKKVSNNDLAEIYRVKITDTSRSLTLEKTVIGGKTNYRVILFSDNERGINLIREKPGRYRFCFKNDNQAGWFQYCW